MKKKKQTGAADLGYQSDKMLYCNIYIPSQTTWLLREEKND